MEEKFIKWAILISMAIATVGILLSFILFLLECLSERLGWICHGTGQG